MSSCMPCFPGSYGKFYGMQPLHYNCSLLKPIHNGCNLMELVVVQIYCYCVFEFMIFSCNVWLFGFLSQLPYYDAVYLIDSRFQCTRFQCTNITMMSLCSSIRPPSILQELSHVGVQVYPPHFESSQCFGTVILCCRFLYTGIWIASLSS